MRLRKRYTINELRDYSSLFSRNEVVRWYSNDFSSIRKKIERYDFPVFGKHCSYLSYLRYIYSVLEKFYPNEYVYKNEFINKWLISETGGTDSIIFNEFRLGNVVDDLVMFNGNSKVFEIKTLLDKETRLSNQIIQYSKIFNEVYVIVPETKSERYLQICSNVGIISCGEGSSEFRLVRKPIENSEIEVDVLMEVLHTHEYISIVQNYFGFKPMFNDFNKFNICKGLIKEIPNDVLNKEFISIMKTRKRNNEFSKEVKQFNQIFLSMNYSQPQKTKLLNNLRTTVI